MKPIMFRGATGILGAPKNWDDETYGRCIGLPVHFSPPHDYQSVWRPTFLERLKLLIGWNVCLAVHGDAHPPVALELTWTPKANVHLPNVDREAQ